MPAIEKGYAAIAEGQLHFRRASGHDQHAMPLVLLHASPASSRSLVPIMERINGGRDLIAFDTPCNGQSCAPQIDEPEIGDFADMLNRACDTMGLDEIAIYATHTGAHVAAAWASLHPARVKAVMLDGVALLDQAQRDDMLAHYTPVKAPDDSGSQFHWAWQYIRDQMIFFPHYKKDAEHMRAGGVFDASVLHDLVLDVLNNLTTYHMPYRAVFRQDVRRDLAAISQPVLVMSDGDGPLDEAASELRAIMPDAGRADNCDSAAAKAAAIDSFLKEHGYG